MGRQKSKKEHRNRRTQKVRMIQSVVFSGSFFLPLSSDPNVFKNASGVSRIVEWVSLNGKSVFPQDLLPDSGRVSSWMHFLCQGFIPGVW